MPKVNMIFCAKIDVMFWGWGGLEKVVAMVAGCEDILGDVIKEKTHEGVFMSLLFFCWWFWVRRGGLRI